MNTKLSPTLKAFLAFSAVPAAVLAQPPQLNWHFNLPDDAWEFQRVLGPDDAFSTDSRSDGFAISPNAWDSFGYYYTSIGHNQSPPLHAANILAVRWVVGTSASDPEEVPEFRLRMNARDGSFAQTYIVQDAKAGDGHKSATTPLAGQDLYFQTYTDVPNSSKNGKGGDGFFLAFDAMSFMTDNPQRLNEDLVLRAVTVRAITPSDFDPEEGQEYTADFRKGQDGWTPSRTDLAGRRVEHTTNQEGIGIRTFGPGALDGGNTIRDYNFPYGWWEKDDAFTMREGYVYRVKLKARVVANDGETTTSASVPTRLRFDTPFHDFVATVNLGAQSANGDTDGNPTPEGKTFTAWVATPPGLGDVPVDLYWEVWQDSQPVAAGASMVLQDLEIKSWRADRDGDDDNDGDPAGYGYSEEQNGHDNPDLTHREDVLETDQE